MNKLWQWLRGKREIIVYVVIGVLTTGVNWAVYSAMVLWLNNVAVSNGIAWCVAVLFAYVTNKIYVFRQRSWAPRAVLKELGLFIAARLGTGVLEMAGVPFLVSIGLNARVFGVQGALAKMLVSVAVVVLNYLFSKLVVFHQKAETPLPARPEAGKTTGEQPAASRECLRAASAAPEKTASANPTLPVEGPVRVTAEKNSAAQALSRHNPHGTAWLEIVFMIALALGFGFFIATALCPAWPEGGFDSTVFLLTGKGWLNGLLPYRDYFDHKGPVLYMIEALAMLPLRSGSMVWGAEVLFFFASLCLIRAMARMEKASFSVRCLVYVSYTLLLATCLEKGNFSEEYCALFTLLGYWALFSADVRGFRWWTGSVMGAAFALAFWTRPNNALPLCCAIAALAVLLLCRKHFRQLAVLALTGFGAASAVTLAICLPFYTSGALGDLIACYFTFNAQNVAFFSTASSIGRLLSTYFGRYSVMALGLGMFSTGYAAIASPQARERKIAVLAGTAAAVLSCWISHNPFFHYFLLVMPTLALGLIYFYQQALQAATRLWKALRARRARLSPAWLARAALVLAALYCGSVLAHHAIGTFAKDHHETMTTNLQNRLGSLSELIPADEYADTLVIASDNLILWYEVHNQLPIKKYYFGYDFIAQADARRGEEIVRQFETDAPKWVLINAGDAALEPTAQILARHYSLVGQNGSVHLYELVL